MPGSDYVGLFGYLGSGSEIHDLGVEYIDITGYDFVGGLVGDNNEGALMSCYATGWVSGHSCVGGLVGFNQEGPLNSCHATVQVMGDESIGGLVGFNIDSKITSCYVTGNQGDVFGEVFGNNEVGGLVGTNLHGTLIFCHAKPWIVNGGDYIGGLVGHNWGTLMSCYASGWADGDDRIGGLVGQNYGRVFSCYATVYASGYRWVGGLVGITSFHNTYICSSYATGPVYGNKSVGVLVGASWGTVTACFWDTETSGQSGSAGGEGKTTAEMQDINTFLDAGWDFVGERVNGPNDIWRICVNGIHYPKLWWEFADGDLECPDGVDFIDFTAFSSAWYSNDTPTDNWNLHCDISKPPDGVIDEQDLNIFCENWLEGK